jgi:hypothetical protein
LLSQDVVWTFAALALEFGEPDVTNTAGTRNTTNITPVNAAIRVPRVPMMLPSTPHRDHPIDDDTHNLAQQHTARLVPLIPPLGTSSWSVCQG